MHMEEKQLALFIADIDAGLYDATLDRLRDAFRGIVPASYDNVGKLFDAFKSRQMVVWEKEAVEREHVRIALGIPERSA